MEFTYEDLTADEYHHRVAVYQPLTAALRELLDAVIRTEVDDATVHSATETISEVTAALRAQQIPGAYGVRHTAEGRGMAWGNAVIGLRNAIAPPLTVVRGSVTDPVVAHADVELGAAYEGPPGHVHGGVVSLLFDQVLGEAASMTGLPSYTGTLTIRYLRPTPLGPLRIEAFTPERDGRKTLARAAMLVDGAVTAEAEGLFISPRGMTPLHPFAGESR
ncbi:PaaI family thioesterase [Gordonia tangerina]|uniref:Acyl-coenzyme A thioesterase THEM4 n=1 Tax=Gordonia tangerina TaxID=2911060 RepID=A0ABS9DHT9_9ACTN|nr:PaaI family thioesterase [Gordonia tangerina]MCF3938787.1 PaaI family thioesterase [Gordonia tangerina]